MIAIIIPIIGARKINAAIFKMIAPSTDSNPLDIIAAPAKPPISVCEDEEGIPFHQVKRFHIIAAMTPASIIGNVIYCSITVLDTVLAIPKPPIIYFAIKKATKLKNAAHNTARNGERTRVETIVAIELAAS